MVVELEARFQLFDEPMRGEKINTLTKYHSNANLDTNNRVIRSEKTKHSGRFFSVGEMGL